MEMMYVHTTLGPSTLLCKLHNIAFGTQTRYSPAFLVMEKRLSEVEVTFDLISVLCKNYQSFSLFEVGVV